MSTEMSEEHKDALEEEYLYLSVSMKPQIRRLVKFMAEKGTINDEQREDVMDEASDTLKAQTLLDLVLDKNDEAFDDFYEGALNSHLWRTADIIVPENGPHEPNEEDIQEFLPESWPTESHINMIDNPRSMNFKRIGPKHTRMMHLFEDSKKHPPGSEEGTIYNLSLKMKGRMMVINNLTFDNEVEFPQRVAAEFDTQVLDMIFSELGFEIDRHENLTANRMMYVLDQEVKKIEEKNDCNLFVLAILSYGYDGRYIFGADAKMENNQPTNFLEIEKIKGKFAKIKQMARRPKVFLIEAQQTKRDPQYEGEPYRRFNPHSDPSTAGMFYDSFPRMERPLEFDIPSAISIPRKMMNLEREHAMFNKKHPIFKDPKKHCITLPDLSYESLGDRFVAPSSRLDDQYNTLRLLKERTTEADSFFEDYEWESDDEDDDNETQTDDPGGQTNSVPVAGDGTQVKTPTKSDIFSAISTSPERMRYRWKREYGSWFIQAFAYIVVNYSFQLDLASIVTKVNELIRSSTGGAKSRQVCTQESTLSKTLYFFPGLPHN